MEVCKQCSICGLIPTITMIRGLDEGIFKKGWIARCCRELRIPIWENKTKLEAVFIFNKQNCDILTHIPLCTLNQN